jgi:hypothetical protein
MPISNLTISQTRCLWYDQSDCRKILTWVLTYGRHQFSATYVPLQPVMVILARRIGVKYFITMQLVAWGGLCSTCACYRANRHHFDTSC